MSKFKILVSVIFILSLTLNLGCNRFLSPKFNQKLEPKREIVAIGWEFTESTIKEPDSDFEYPATEIFFFMLGKETKKIFLGTYLGKAYEVQDISNTNFPSSTLSACQTWHGGGGEDLYVIRVKDYLIIQRRELYEVPLDNEEGHDIEYDGLKTIAIFKLTEQSSVKPLWENKTIFENTFGSFRLTYPCIYELALPYPLPHLGKLAGA